MKKIFLLLFLLTGCMSTQKDIFEIKEDNEVHFVKVNQVESVSMVSYFDSENRIENEMPVPPQEAINNWVKEHLQAQGQNGLRLLVVTHQADMLRESIPNESFFKFDEERYVLNYRLELQVRQGETLLKTKPVEGKGFVILAKKASIATKEKAWAWLTHQMLSHLKLKIQEGFENFVP